MPPDPHLFAPIVTHADLVEVAARWLRSLRLRVITTDRCTMVDEQPDAIGWRTNGWSWLVECKVSRADFVRDQKKRWRKPGQGIGNYRYYLMPPGLIRADELPTGWGLLEREGRRTVMKRKSEWWAEKNQREEIALLVRCATPPELVKRPDPKAARVAAEYAAQLRNGGNHA